VRGNYWIPLGKAMKVNCTIKPHLNHNKTVISNHGNNYKCMIFGILGKKRNTGRANPAAATGGKTSL